MQKDCQHNLWDLVKQGNETAFRQLFEQHWEALFLYACRVTKDNSLAQDIVQGLFIHLWEKHAVLPDVAAIQPYLRSALRNRLLNAIRDEHVYQRHVDLFHQLLTVDDHSTIEQLQLKETETLLLQSLDTLPEKMKDVFYLHRIEQLSVAEIASRFGTSPQTVRNQLNMALQRLKALWIIKVLICCWFLR